jgi:hypothetical protein
MCKQRLTNSQVKEARDRKKIEEERKKIKNEKVNENENVSQ